MGTNAVVLVQLNGANTDFAAGLRIESSNSVVKGLVINRFSTGILTQFELAGNNKIEGNFIGTDPSGTLDRGNTNFGAFINFGSNNTVGGTSPAARNLISGNGRDGVLVQGSGTQVLGNLIGTDRTGREPLANDGSGVWSGWPDQTIGGGAAAANVIAFNGGDGVVVMNDAATGNAIPRNSIFSNGGQGIDLGDDGRTPNDVGDADTGPNNRQNFPVLTSARTENDRTFIEGHLNSTPSTTFVVRYFSTAQNDTEGQQLIGSTTVITDANGNGSFSISTLQPIPAGRRITATATDPGGNTSEFSAPRTVTEVS